jgi:ABC-2 type transport system permease protein
MRRILAIARKEFIHITRDKRLIGMILVLPLMQLFLYAYALSFDVKHLETAVLDLDHTTFSTSYVNALQQSNYFQVTRSVANYDEIDADMENGAVKVAVVIADGFGSSLAAGRPGRVQILVDGSNPNSAQIGQTYASALSRAYGAKIVVSQLEAKGFSVDQAAGLSAVTRTWYNPEGKSAAYFVPGLIVLLVTMVTVAQTANALVREKEAGTQEQLIVSPISRLELMIGKIAPWALIGVLDIAVIGLTGVLAFGVPFRGSIALLALASLLYVVCALGLGLVVSARATSVDSANQVATMVSLLPTLMLSGFVFPLNSMPWVVQGLSYLFPARYFMTICRTIFLKGAGFSALWPDYAALTLWAVLIVVLAASLYRERA